MIATTAATSDQNKGTESKASIKSSSFNSVTYTSTTNTTTTTIAATGAHHRPLEAALISPLTKMIKQHADQSRPATLSPPRLDNDQGTQSTTTINDNPHQIRHRSICDLNGHPLATGHYAGDQAIISNGLSSSYASTVTPSSSVTSSYSSAAAHSPSANSIVSAHSSASISPTSNSSSRSSRSPISANLLDYYPEINHNALALTWAHSANTRDSLLAALRSDKIIVAGDIALAEVSRYPVPIMANPKHHRSISAGELSLEIWLQEVGRWRSSKAIKLTFTSTRTIEPAFRVLAKHAEHIRGPLILAADIMSWPTNQQGARHKGTFKADNGSHQQPVDAWTFLMLCRTRFPRSIISIGWCCSGRNSGKSASRSIEKLVSPFAEPISAPSLVKSASSEQIFELDIGHRTQPLSSALQRHPALSQLISSGPLRSQSQTQNPDQTSQTTNRLITSQLSQLLSSAGSPLNSSSGNSSGSPSPTSPIGQLLGTTPTLGRNSSQSGVHAGSILAASLMGIATSASEAASFLTPLANSRRSYVTADGIHRKLSAHAASHSYQQQPLNLNINEAADRQTQAPLAKRLLNAPAASEHVHKKLASGSSDQLARPSSRSVSPRGADVESQTINGTIGYTREMIDRMSSLVKEYNLTQPITFPVEAKLLNSSPSSIIELQRLLYQVGGNSTLTITARPDDLMKVDDLLLIQKSFASNQVIYDLPDDLTAALRLRLGAGR